MTVLTNQPATPARRFDDLTLGTDAEDYLLAVHPQTDAERAVQARRAATKVVDALRVQGLTGTELTTQARLHLDQLGLTETLTAA